MKIKVEVKVYDNSWYNLRQKSGIINIFPDDEMMRTEEVQYLVEMEAGKLFLKLQKELYNEKNKAEEEDTFPKCIGCDPEEKEASKSPS